MVWLLSGTTTHGVNHKLKKKEAERADNGGRTHTQHLSAPNTRRQKHEQNQAIPEQQR